MLLATKGIVLNSIRYSDTSLIVSIFTREAGIYKYMVKGAARPKSKLPVSIFMPLTVLEMIVFHKEQANLQSIREARLAPMLLHLHENPYKQMLVLFASEVLIKSMHTNESNEELFDWLENSICNLDQSDKFNNWILEWLLDFAGFLGFTPFNNYHEKANPCFNLTEGIFDSEFSFSLSPEHSKLIHKWLVKEVETVNAPDKKVLMTLLMRFYASHIPNFKTPNSLEVLHAILA